MAPSASGRALSSVAEDEHTLASGQTSSNLVLAEYYHLHHNQQNHNIILPNNEDNPLICLTNAKVFWSLLDERICLLLGGLLSHVRRGCDLLRSFHALYFRRLR